MMTYLTLILNVAIFGAIYVPSYGDTTQCVDKIPGHFYLTVLQSPSTTQEDPDQVQIQSVIQQFINLTNENVDIKNKTIGYRDCLCSDLNLESYTVVNHTIALFVLTSAYRNLTSSIKNVPVFIVISGLEETVYSENHFMVQPRFYEEIQLFEQLIRETHLNHFGVVTFDNDIYGDIADSKFMTAITKIKSCFYYIKLSSSPSTNDQNVVNDFWFNNRKNVVLLFGSKANINNLFQVLPNDTISKITWVGHSAWTYSLKLNNTKYKKNIERLVKPVPISNHFPFTEKLRNSYFDSQPELGLMQNILNALDVITQTLVQVVNQTANLKTSENTPKPSENTTIVVTRRLVIERFQAFQNNTNHLVRFNSSTNQNGIIAFPNSNTSDNLNLLTSGNYTIKCAKKECRFDYKSSYGNLSTNTPRQTKTYKYFCIKCENNDVSPSCRRQYEHIQYYSTSAYIIYTIVTLGVLSGVTICVIFYRFRKTPYVKASHQNMSLVQLFAHLLLFLAPLMFFGTPSEALCTARPIAFGILFTFIMAMTLTKTQKLNFIFQARIRVSKRQIQMSQKMEVSLILLMMFVQTCIAGLSYLMSSSRVLVVAYQGTKKSNYTIKCNTDEEFFIQLLFGFLLSLMCMIQAFKARNLPENFNETKLIFTTMFLCDVAVCVWFAIRFTSSESSTRVHADVLLLLSMNFILLIIMYGHKCWIIIFHPELNTTSAFKENIKRHNLREMVPSHVTMNHRDSTFSGITSISTPPDLRSTIVRHSMDNLSYTHN